MSRLGVPCRLGYGSLVLNRKRRADYTNTVEKRRRLATLPRTLHPPTPSDFRSIQNVSDPGGGLLASHLDIVASRIANKPELKERISDDGRFSTSAIGEQRRSIGNRRGRRNCRDFGPATSLHPVWMAHSTRDCRGPARTAGFPWGRRHLCPGSLSALPYRLLSSGCLLRGKPQAAFYEGIPTGVRFVLWRRG